MAIFDLLLFSTEFKVSYPPRQQIPAPALLESSNQIFFYSLLIPTYP